MSVIIHALFSRLYSASKAATNLEADGIPRSEIAVIKSGDQGVREASHLLDQHGIADATAATYTAALSNDGALLWVRLEPAAQTKAAAVLQQAGATDVVATTLNDDADELSEAEGWDDFNQHGNEHSPDSTAESMWASRDGNAR